MSVRDITQRHLDPKQAFSVTDYQSSSRLRRSLSGFGRVPYLLRLLLTVVFLLLCQRKIVHFKIPLILFLQLFSSGIRWRPRRRNDPGSPHRITTFPAQSPSRRLVREDPCGLEVIGLDRICRQRASAVPRNCHLNLLPSDSIAFRAD